MKCVIDLELLNPPPIPGTRHFAEILLHRRKLAESNVKIALSHELQSLVWNRWNQVQSPQHKEFLLEILTRYLASCFPNNLIVDTGQIRLTPPFLSGESEWVVPWLSSLTACYLDEQFNTGGAFLATWPHPEFVDQKTVQVTYRDLTERLSLVRNEVEWDKLLTTMAQVPIPFTSSLRAYADEGGSRHDSIVSIVVIAEKDANSVARSAIETFNQRKPHGCSEIREIHFRALDQHGNANRRELARQLLAEQIVEGMCNVNAVCFIACKDSRINQIELYTRALRDTLNVWSPNLIHPIYVDTPYDPTTDNLKNRELRSRIFNAIQSKGFDCCSDDIVLGKSTNYLGLGLADAIAYLYFRRNDAVWQNWWQRLNNESILQFT